MSHLHATTLLETDLVAIRDVICDGACRHRSPEEAAQSTSLVFPYRGVFMRHLGDDEAVAEASQVVFFNRGDVYSISHPVEGGDACLSLSLPEILLDELVPDIHRRPGETFAFNKQRLGLDARAQVQVALLRHSLISRTAEPLEGEALAMTLVRRAVGERTTRPPVSGFSTQKLVNRTKLLLSSDLARRWTLTEIASETGVSPVYLTQVFRKIEGMPLYRYQLRLRLARALDLLGSYDDLTDLGLELGFSSHSHFSSSFRQAYGRTPAEFQRFAGLR
ncbi:helix-turn-helix transcriptional regulator [Neorhizobium alkalisoli]|uniref:AraC family transcriptional regulator n=1 Tax=Neorhizobium alkalisoli TaxID=528178 RepID=A0A561QX67_9HYPH|nr:helix-turn-helix domain-containing protein [Neorhizobium alkalisoli]TWF54909.1 AraC family transcriptional regulator [Neorhizobium alkalisoli]